MRRCFALSFAGERVSVQAWAAQGKTEGFDEFGLLEDQVGCDIVRIPMISDTQSEIVGHRSDNYRTVVGA